MKRSSTVFLQVVIVLTGIGALAFMLWEPHIEGRNVNATLFEIYFNDPFLAYAYIASIPFFMALYQAFKLLGYIGQNKIFSLSSMRALRTIKYCAIFLIGFIVAPEAYLFIARPGDDIAGGVAVGLFLIFVSVIVATAAAVFEKTLQSAVDINKFQSMKKNSTLFLKLIISFIGIVVFVLCILFISEVTKAGGGLFLPILIIMYVTAIPFFFALYQTLKLLGYIDKNLAFSELSVKALRNIKYCAIAISVLYVVGMPLLVSVADKDDAPGAVGFGLIFILASIVVATFAVVLQRLVQNRLDTKSENDLAV